MPDPIDLSKSMVSVKQACELARISRRTLYNWMGAGKVRWIRTAGGAPRIFTASLFRTDERVGLHESAGQ